MRFLSILLVSVAIWAASASTAEARNNVSPVAVVRSAVNRADGHRSKVDRGGGKVKASNIHRQIRAYGKKGPTAKGEIGVRALSCVGCDAYSNVKSPEAVKGVMIRAEQGVVRAGHGLPSELVNGDRVKTVRAHGVKTAPVAGDGSISSPTATRGVGGARATKGVGGARASGSGTSPSLESNQGPSLDSNQEGAPRAGGKITGGARAHKGVKTSPGLESNQGAPRADTQGNGARASGSRSRSGSETDVLSPRASGSRSRSGAQGDVLNGHGNGARAGEGSGTAPQLLGSEG